MVPGDAKDFVPLVTEPLEKLASFGELLGPCALSEIAADHDKVGFQRIGFALYGGDEILIVGAKMQVRKMDEASHAP